MNKILKYILLLAIACFAGKASAQELKSEVFSILNLDYPGLEKVKAWHLRLYLPDARLLLFQIPGSPD